MISPLKPIIIFGVLIFSSVFRNNVILAQTCNYSLTNNYNITVDTGLIYKTIVYYNTALLRYDTLDLKMDVVKPIGDNNGQRPLVIYFHGTNESYKNTQLHVKRMVDVLVKERGFVLASVDYKLWAMPYVENTPSGCGSFLALLLGIYYPYDLQESIRSFYRATQDANDAISFMASRNTIDSTCLSHFFLSGFSAGGLVASSAGYMSVNEKPQQAGIISPALYTNIFGTVLTPTVNVPRNDLGPVITNQALRPAIKGVLLFNSGMQNIGLISVNDPPLFIYHSLNDPNISIDSSTTVCYTESKFYGQTVIKNYALTKQYLPGQNLVLLNGNTLHDFFDTQIRVGADFINQQINNSQCACDSSSAVYLNSYDDERQIKIYSNFSTVIIDAEKSDLRFFSVKVKDILGKEIVSSLSQMQSYLEMTINTKPGIYFVEIRGENFTKTQKIFLFAP